MSELVTYVVEPRISRFQVQAFAAGLLSALGHNPVFAIRGMVGDVSVREETLEDASVVIRVDAGSLHLVDDMSERDRREIERNMRRDVLEIERFPEIMYVSSRIDIVEPDGSPRAVRLLGNLTLHGETRELTINARVSTTGGLLRAFGEFSIWQSDYSIQLVTVAGGTLRLKDEVKLSFDLGARRIREPEPGEGRG